MIYSSPEHEVEGFNIFVIPRSMSYLIEKKHILRYLDPEEYISVSA